MCSSRFRLRRPPMAHLQRSRSVCALGRRDCRLRRSCGSVCTPRHPDKPLMFACADCPRRGFCGSTRAAPRDGRAARSAVARLGLAMPEVESKECTSEEVLRRVQDSAVLQHAATGCNFTPRCRTWRRMCPTGPRFRSTWCRRPPLR